MMRKKRKKIKTISGGRKTQSKKLKIVRAALLFQKEDQDLIGSISPKRKRKLLSRFLSSRKSLLKLLRKLKS